MRPLWTVVMLVAVFYCQQHLSRHLVRFVIPLVHVYRHPLTVQERGAQAILAEWLFWSGFLTQYLCVAFPTVPILGAALSIALYMGCWLALYGALRVITPTHYAAPLEIGMAWLSFIAFLRDLVIPTVLLLWLGRRIESDRAGA